MRSVPSSLLALLLAATRRAAAAPVLPSLYDVTGVATGRRAQRPRRARRRRAGDRRPSRPDATGIEVVAVDPFRPLGRGQRRRGRRLGGAALPRRAAGGLGSGRPARAPVLLRDRAVLERPQERDGAVFQMPEAAQTLAPSRRSTPASPATSGGR